MRANEANREKERMILMFIEQANRFISGLIVGLFVTIAAEQIAPKRLAIPGIRIKLIAVVFGWVLVSFGIESIVPRLRIVRPGRADLVGDSKMINFPDAKGRITILPEILRQSDHVFDFVSNGPAVLTNTLRIHPQ